MAAKIHIERMMHRSSIAVLGEQAATYALLKLIPSGAGGTTRPMTLNIALALDVSGSMYEEDGTGVSRLQRVQDAAAKALEELNPDDTMSVIAFGHNAGVLLPPTKIAEKDKIIDIIRKIDMFDVDPGGTAMDEGMALAMSELEKVSGTGSLSQMVVLTDGETSGEQNCKVLAKKLIDKKINLSLMGVGTDWKDELIKELSTLSNGKWYYIDVNNKAEAERIFKKEFEALAATGFTEVEMILRPMKDIKLKRVRMVVPEVKELKLDETGERQLSAKLGALQHDQTSRYILDLTVPKRPDGKYVIAQVEITYDLGTGKRESSGLIPLEMTYTAAGHGYVNAEVMKHIDDIQLKEMSDNLQKALASNDMEGAKQAAQQMEKKGEIMGKRAAKKTMLAKQVLDEMNAGGGRVSKKTMLAATDAMREASEAPAG
jgi:Ca-activated chloride channel family protein